MDRVRPLTLNIKRVIVINESDPGTLLINRLDVAWDVLQSRLLLFDSGSDHFPPNHQIIITSVKASTLTRGCLKVHGGVSIVLCLFGDPL